MATGDQQDCLARLKMVLPARWLGDTSPVADAILSGPAYAMSLVYSLAQYAKNQTRIATATDGFLDLIAWDFFRNILKRRAGESDTPFRARILANLFREKATRNGIIATLTALTGRAPIIFEPARIQDTGAYNSPTLGYGVAGGYGSLQLPCQAFVTAFRPSNSGIPNVAGYGSPSSGYSVPSQGEYASLSMVNGFVTDSDIYAAVDAAKADGTIMWTRISN